MSDKELRRSPLLSEIEQYEQELLSRPPERFSILLDAAPKKPLENLGKEDWIYWGGHLIPIDDFIGSSLTLGRSRSGKTLQVEPFLCSVIAAIGRGNKMGAKRRLINYDAKVSMLPFFHYYCEKYDVPLYYFNLSDDRSITIDFAKDLAGRSDYFLEFSKIAIPTPEKGEPFWSHVAQALSHAGLLGLQSLYGSKWGLHHYYALALVALPHLETILSLTPYGRLIKERFLPRNMGENTVFGFTSQLSSSLRQLEVAATHQYELSQKSMNRFVSIKDFLNTNAVLLVSTDIDLRLTTDKIIQILTRNLVNHLGNKPDNQTRPFDRTIVTIDEFPVWGKLSGIDELTSFTPSKGSFAYLIIQDISQMYKRYGREDTHTIAGNCQWQLYFAPASSESAQFYSDYLGQYEFGQLAQTYSYQSGEFGRTMNFTRQKEPLLLPGELRTVLPPAHPRHGSRFIAMQPYWNHPYLQQLSPAEIERRKPKSSSIALRVPRAIHPFPVDEIVGLEERMAIHDQLRSQHSFESYMEAFSKEPEEVKEWAKMMFATLSQVTDEQLSEIHKAINERAK